MFALDREFYYLAIEWFELALALLEDGTDPLNATVTQMYVANLLDTAIKIASLRN